MKKFMKNLSFEADFKLYVPPLMYKINAYNMKWCKKLGRNPD